MFFFCDYSFNEPVSEVICGHTSLPFNALSRFDAQLLRASVHDQYVWLRLTYLFFIFITRHIKCSVKEIFFLKIFVRAYHHR